MTDHDHDHDHDGHEQDGVPAASLTLDSVPALAGSVAMAVLDGEGVVLDEATRATHLLNPPATLTVQCFDGSSTVEQICADLSEELSVALDVMQRDVLALVQQLGAKGLLAGVRATPQARQAPEQPTLPVGTRLDGLEAALDQATGTPLLLVSWSPGCGYCTRIIDDLVAVQQELVGAGVQLRLLTTGAPEAVAAQLGERRLPVTHLDEVPDFFAGLGTPVAYATDAEGRTTERLALGAGEVPELARRLAGLNTAS